MARTAQSQQSSAVLWSSAQLLPLWQLQSQQLLTCGSPP